MGNLPKDPMLLYSFVNMNLRDEYDSLEDFCSAQDVSPEEIVKALEAAGFSYDKTTNQFR